MFNGTDTDWCLNLSHFGMVGIMLAMQLIMTLCHRGHALMLIADLTPDQLSNYEQLVHFFSKQTEIVLLKMF